MSRNVRSNFLTDKSTFGNSTMPIGAIVPIFKATDDKVTDNGVVDPNGLGQVVSGAGGGTGYVTDLGTIAGYPTTPIDFNIPAGTAFEVGTDNVNIPNHPFVEGDQLTVVSTDQAPNQTKLGASIFSITVDNAGTNYTAPPVVQVTDNGSGPTVAGTFQAEFDSNTGTVTGINVINGGSGYQFPVVTLIGGGGNNDATASPTLALNGVGGVSISKGFKFLVDVVDANNIKLTRSNGDISVGKYYNITDLGSNGTIRVASSTGFGLTVGIAANLNGSVNFVTVKKQGYGYSNGDVVYISQPGSSGTARVEIVNTSSTTASEPDMQYEGWLYCDGSEYDAQDYPLLYEVIEDKYGGLGGTYDPEDFGQASGIKFNVPDYKARKLVGAGGGVSGGGSPVSGNVISTVGQTGGRWFFSKTQQEALFDIGNIVITGYPNVQEFVGGNLTGEVTLQIGPLQEKLLTSVPEHDHAVLTSTAPQAGAFEGTGQIVDSHLASYKDSQGQVSFFLPTGGTPLFHSHGVVDYIITDPSLSTFGNIGGIGETVDVTFTATNIIGEAGGTRFNIASHDLNTGYKIRVKSNAQTTQCVFNVDGTSVAFAQNTEWYVIKIDDDNFYLATSKYKAKTGQVLFASTNGSAGQDIVIELAYKIAGNLPADQVTVIQQPNDTVYDINDTYTIGGKTVQLPGGTSTSTVTITESNVAGSYTVPAPTVEQSPIAGVSGFLGGAGGGGATSDVDGTNGGDTYYEFNYNGSQIQIVSEGGAGGDSYVQLLQTRDWVAVDASNISSGAAAVWSSFLLQYGIYRVAPVGGSDPYVGQWIEAGVGIEVDASLAAAGFNVEFHCDGSSEMDLYNPDGTWKQGNATPPNTTGPGVPYTSSATLVVPANTLVVGWNQLKCRVKNDFASNSDDSWANNPGGIGFVATRNDTGATMFTSRTACTGGVTTTTLPGGGGGGAGGQCRIVSGGAGATNVTTTGQYTVNGLPINISVYYGGNDGTDGSPTLGGTGGPTSLVGGSGGDGARTLYTGTNNVNQSFTTPNTGANFFTYSIPQNWPLDSLKAVIKGGGGGSGGTGDGGTGWWAGNGGNGKNITVNVSTTSAALRVYVGGGGSTGVARVGGAGSQTGFSVGGTGGNGTGGGGGGGGGASSAIGTTVNILAGAAGGGGGGAAGDTTQGADQNGGPGANDGAQNISSVFSGSGGNGQNSVCSGGGGGGGGGGVGSGSGIGGGGGAGNGSNARRDGYGATRGQSAFKGSGTGGTCSLISAGDATNGAVAGLGQQIDGSDGSVDFTATENQTFYGSGGGGGGSGSYFYFNFDATDINAGTLVVGQPGNASGDVGMGNVSYQVSEFVSGGTTTSVTSGLINSASTSVDYVQSGTGSGVNGGFASVDGEKYLRFFGNEAIRWARSVAIDATVSNSKSSEINTVKIRVIRGNGSNGGETPNEPLELFGSNDNATSFVKIGTISSSNGPTTWEIVDVPLPTNMRVNNLVLEVRQTRSGAGNPDNDNFGIDYVAFVHNEVESTVTTYPSAKADLGIEFVTERIEPQGDPLNSAGLDVNEGTFTLSSAVKLSVDSTLQPNIDIPLLTRYHLVKYMIRAY